MVFAGLIFDVNNRIKFKFDLSGGDLMKSERDNKDRPVGDEIDEIDEFCEACCCFDIEACESLHSQGCKVDTTCCW